MVLASWLVLSWPWLSQKVTIPYDAKAHFYPQLQFLAHSLHSGQSPFWTPNIFVGSPQIADPQSMIFSPALLIAFFDPNPGFRALDLYALSLLLAAALAIVALFRELRWHPAGATVAALVYAFGGSAAWRLQHIKQVQSYAFLGIAICLLTIMFNRRRPGWGAAAGAAIGLMLVEPGQVALLGGYFIGALAVTALLSAERDARAELFIPCLACGLVAAAIAALPVLMSFEFVRLSSRVDVPFDAAGRGSLHPGSLITLFLGDLFAPGSAKISYWGPPSQGWNPDNLAVAHNMCQLYTGALSGLALVIVGVFHRAYSRPGVLLYVVALIAASLYALGWYTPAFRIFYDNVPFIHLFRRPADATFLVNAMLAISAGYFVHVAANEDLGNDRRYCVATAVLLLGIVACGVAVAVWRGHLSDALAPLVFSSFLLTASAVVLLQLCRVSSRSSSFAVVLVAALSIIDLGTINGANPATGLPYSQYAMLDGPTHEPTILLLKEWLSAEKHRDRRDRVELTGLGFEWPNTGMIHGFDHVLGYNPLRLAEITEGVGAGDTIAIPQQRRFTPLFPSYQSRLADLLGLRYIATSVPIEQIDRQCLGCEFKLVAKTATARIYENPHALPRVLFASATMPADFTAIKRSGRWPDFDPRRSVLLDAVDVRTDQRTSSLRRRSPLGRAAILRYENTIVEVETASPQRGYLVLNDVWHPWWRATVDGVAAPVLRANVLFRAVAVPSGRHRVRFEFAPFSGLVSNLVHRAWQ